MLVCIASGIERARIACILHVQQQHTRVVNAVFPPPLGPTSKNVDSPVEAAAFLYRKACSKIGKTMAIANVIRIVDGFGDSAWVSQLSSSYQAMLPRYADKLSLSFSIQVLGRALAVAQLYPYICAGEGDARSSGGEFRVFEGSRAGISDRGTRCWRSGDDVTRGFTGLAPSVAALGLDRRRGRAKVGNSAVPLGAQSRSLAAPPLPCFPAANQTPLSFLAPHLKK